MEGPQMKFLDSTPAWSTVCVPVLSSQLRDWGSFSAAVHRIHEGTCEASEEFAKAKQLNLRNLAAAIEWMHCSCPGFDFYGSLLPFLQAWALRLPELTSSSPPVPVLV
eukprot:RCo054586